MAAGVASATASGQIYTGNIILRGWNVVETAGIAAEIELYNGTSTSGTKVARVKLGGGQSVGEWYAPSGVTCQNGIYLNVVSGTVEVLVYV